MKKSIIFLFTFFVIISCRAQWEFQYPLPTGEVISDAGTFSGQNTFIVGYNGLLMKTADTGNTMTHVNIPTQAFLKSIFCFDEAVGFIGATNGGVFKSTDAGENWSKIRDSQVDVNATFFALNNQKAWISEKAGELAVTNDGGQSWTTIFTNIDSLLTKISFVNESEGYAVIDESPLIYQRNDTVVVKTTDGGASWDTIPVAFTSNIYFIKTYGEENIWIGSDELVVASYDSGLTWDTINIPEARYWEGGARDMAIKNADTFWILVQYRDEFSLYSRVFYSSDRGQNWTKQLSHSTSTWANDCSAFLNYIKFEKGSCWGLGGSGVIYSKPNLDAEWQKHFTSLKEPLFDICFPDNKTGFAVGYSWNFMKTVDGGKNWTLSESLPEFDTYVVEFLTPTKGFIIDGHMKAHMTVDGGENWFVVLETEEYMADISFAGEDKGWVITADGEVYVTENEGYNWNLFSTIPTENSIYEFQFIDESTGIAIGSHGDIWRTEDGGLNWALVFNLDEYKPFVNMFFLNDELGWVVGRGEVCKTNNGGKTWELILQDYNKDFNAIAFVDDKKGYMTAILGGMYKTEDGGYTWEVDQEDIIAHGAFATIGNEIWAATHCGIRYKKENLDAVPEAGYQSENGITLFPNPAKSTLTIKSTESIMEYTVFNALGKSIKQEPIGKVNSHQVDISNLSPGLYFLKIKTPDGYWTLKFIKSD